MEESFKYHIPEDIPANERTAFHGAAAAAAKDGKKSFNFGGKTHPVTMKKDLANKIADQKESVNESFSYHNDMAKAHKSHAMRHNSEYHHGNHNDDDEDSDKVTSSEYNVMAGGANVYEYSYTSSSAHTKIESESNVETTISNHNNRLLSDSVNTSDINMISVE